jgi:nucleotide-binding universal stress UspA family protein
VPLEDSGAAPAMLATAWLAARRFSSTVEALYVRRSLPGVVVADIGGYAAATPDLMQSFEQEDQQRAGQVRALFESFVREHGGAKGEAVEAIWTEASEPGDQAVGMYARVFDMTVVGRPVAGQSVPAMSTLESVLFESGRPILIAPPTPPASLGDTIVIHWNGSTETARATALALPFLIRAKKVVVVSVEGVMVPGPNAEAMARYLKRNGIAAQLRELPADSRSGGAAVLAEAKSLGADLLVKGAYTHSRLRQMIFGGATSHILATAEIPVLMAH